RSSASSRWPGVTRVQSGCLVFLTAKICCPSRIAESERPLADLRLRYGVEWTSLTHAGRGWLQPTLNARPRDELEAGTAGAGRRRNGPFSPTEYPIRRSCARDSPPLFRRRHIAGEDGPAPQNRASCSDGGVWAGPAP